YGFLYASLSDFPQFKGKREKELKEFAYELIRYVAVVFAKKIDHQIDFKTRIFEAELDGYIVCSKDGLGYLFTSGSIAGIWSWAMDDPSVEGVEIRCQGRGDKTCSLVCGPLEALKEKKLEVQIETSLPEAKFGVVYRDLNRIRPATHSRTSLKSLLDNKFFGYNAGKISFRGERYFSTESHITYLLENDIGKIEGGKEKLFDIIFSYAKNFSVKNPDLKNNFEKFIMDYFSGSGWGDILLTNTSAGYSVFINFFPWTEFSEISEFIFLRAYLSGFLSGFLGRNVILKLNSRDIKGGNLSVALGE
ncbi:MAG: hypothetical protein JXB14_06660, partial [Candidatus Altiarchaeota archaeon]|nr:hypothetical protein [Candidatus Altiarchaeota archaeon]